MTEFSANFDALSAVAMVAGAVFFIGDIIVLGLIFKRLFAMVKDSAGQQGLSAGDSQDGQPVFSLEEPAGYEDRSTEAAPPKTQIVLLVLLKFILLVPVLIGLLYVFSAKVPALFAGMLIGLVIVCAYLYISRRIKPSARG